MDKREEFTIDILLKDRTVLKELFESNGYGNEFKSIQSIEDIWNCSDEFHNWFWDNIQEFIESEAVHDPDSDVWFEGGDEDAFEDGRYAHKCYRILGWSYWISPEGEITGLFREEEEKPPW